MKVVAFNASPRRDSSTSDFIMNLFLDGAKEAGAEIESYYVVDLDINGCTGCFTCWTKTPGRCIHRDDMDWIIPRYREADVVYLGTPIYNNNIIHYLQRMLERMLPTSLPYMVEEEGRTRHPDRFERKRQRRVLAAVAGFPDESAFKQVSGLFSSSLHIFLPSSEIVRDPEGSKAVGGFLSAVSEAGRQIVSGEVGDDVKRRLVVEYDNDLKKIIREQANKYFDSQISE